MRASRSTRMLGIERFSGFGLSVLMAGE
jgi:hypothetical protein